MQPHRKKILVAVDGSGNSLEAVRYVGRLMPPKATHITLFNVFEVLPESCWDTVAGRAPAPQSVSLLEWGPQQRKLIEGFMQRAVNLLREMGYDPQSIATVIRPRNIGVARDIARETRQGYDALVLGRRGRGDLRDLICGSVASKLMSHVRQVPFWLVGIQPHPSGILIAMDQSEGAMRALNHVSGILGAACPELLLLHVTRGIDPPHPIAEKDAVRDCLREAREQLEQAEQKMRARFVRCVEVLERRGVDVSRVRTLIVPGVYSRAGAIFGEALTRGYGTIVVGRRGLSRVDEFMMGGVSSKVVQLAQEMAVWIVQ